MIDFRRLVLKNSKNISSSKIRFGRNFTKHLVKQGSHCISPRNPIDKFQFMSLLGSYTIREAIRKRTFPFSNQRKGHVDGSLAFDAHSKEILIILIHSFFLSSNSQLSSSTLQYHRFAVAYICQGNLQPQSNMRLPCQKYQEATTA